jgi:hypothetical protein
MRLLSIEPEERGVIGRLPGDGAMAEPRGLCHMTAGDKVEFREVIRAVIGEGIICEGNMVQGPLWLIDLSMRLVRGERVVVVDPGERWEATVRMLSGRGVQAFVIAQGGAALETGASIVSWPQ